MTPTVFPAAGLLFDLDGTLVDSVPDICLAANLMLDDLGLPRVEHPRLRNWVGNGAETLVKRALTGDMHGEPDAALLERAVPRFFAAYLDNICVHSVLYPGVAETLEHFSAAGFHLACVTNKPSRHTAALLEATGLASLFGAVVAGDDLAEKKPHPAPLQAACEQLALAVDDCLMIGDSASDVRAARAAGMPVLYVTYGYNQGLDPATLEPDALVDSFDELPQRIETRT